MIRRHSLPLLLLALLLPAVMLAAAEAAGAHFIMLGSRVLSTEHYPVIDMDGRLYVSIAVLQELGGAGQGSGFSMGAGQDEVPVVTPHEHEDPDESGGKISSDIEVPSSAADELQMAQGSLPAPAAGFSRIPLGPNALDVAADGSLLAQVNGKPIAEGELVSWQGQRYVSAGQLARLGLKLIYNHHEQLYQLAGLIYKVEYRRDEPALVLSSITPLSMEGVQEKKEEDDKTETSKVTVNIEGGYFPEMKPLEYSTDDNLERVAFKSQPELGRSFIFLRQPYRTGFRVHTDPRRGFSKLRLGNYFQVASYNLTSSGEISLNVQMGASCEISHELVPNPWRLVVDFPCAIYDEATQTIPVNLGHVQAIRVGTPAAGQVRVVMDLSEKLDYRVLSKDDGARYYFQLLPATPQVATPLQRRSGRTIMLDPGHGGSDPGARGVLSGVWEAPLALSISKLTAAELRGMGYTVLETRTDDRFVSLGSRGDYANSALPFVFVSIHCNHMGDSSHSGPISFFYKGSTEGGKLASLIQQEIVAATGANDKGTQDWGDFFVLRETVMPSVLVEAGFLSNKAECAALADPAYQKKVAKGIARGIDLYIAGR